VQDETKTGTLKSLRPTL